MGRIGGPGGDVSALPGLLRPAASERGDLVAALAASLYALWQARDLLSAWREAPYERGVWLALALWLIPVALRRQTPPTAAIGAALALSVAGALLSLHVLTHIGLAATALAWSAMPAARRAGWALTALAWMPTGGWLLAHLGLAPLPALGLRLAAAGLGAWIGGRR